MKKSFFLALLFSALCLSDLAQSRPATKAELIVIKAAISSSTAAALKDPESAQLKNVQLTPEKSGFLVCGEINAKNGYGGYTGFSKFAGIYFIGAKDGKPIALIVAIDSGDERVADKMCEPKSG